MSTLTDSVAYKIETSHTIWILQVEDNPGDARIVFELLKDIDRYQFELVQVATLKAALEQFEHGEFDVVLLDLSLPDSQGLLTLEKIRLVVPDMPIVVLTGNNDEEVALEAIQKGAQDYLPKDQLNHHILMRTIRYAIDRKQAEIDLSYMAQYDALTGLANRSLFQDRMRQAVIRAQRNQDMIALCYLDLDHFKSVNDTYGHHVGDLLLKEVADRIRCCVRKGDTIARLGGDEFTIIIENIQDKNSVTIIAQKIIESLSQPYQLSEFTVSSTVSMGVSIEQGAMIKDAQALIKNTDLAMYRAKKNGRNNFKVFTTELRAVSETKQSLEQDLHIALKHNQFFLRYQPQIDIKENKLIGAEALLRWAHPTRGIVYPEAFIPALEETGLIVPVGEWVLRTACRQWADWQQAGLLPQASAVSVNLSVHQFKQYDMVGKVIRVLYESGLDAKLLSLEITENLILEKNKSNISALNELKDCGVSISIDDFGTGFNSLGYLKHFPIDCLKVDRTFVEDILESKVDAAIATSIINLANNLDMRVIAEGVDASSKVDFLKQRGCSAFQGNYFSNPLMPDEFARQYIN